MKTPVVVGPLLPEGYCWYCGIRLDAPGVVPVHEHVFPRHYHVTPIVRACNLCNSSKQALDPDAWRQRLLHPGYRPYGLESPGCRLSARQPLFWYERVGLTASPLGQLISWFRQHAEEPCHIQSPMDWWARPGARWVQCVTCQSEAALLQRRSTRR